MNITIDQLRDALIRLSPLTDDPFPLVRYVIQKEINQRESVGAKRKYDGDKKERARQASARYREKKRLEGIFNRASLNRSEKAKLRIESKRRTALEEPIDLRPKKKKKVKWRKSEICNLN